MSYARLTFHNACLTLLKREAATKVFKTQADTLDFFVKCFCNKSCAPKFSGEITNMLMGRQIKLGRAKQHSWLQNEFGNFLSNEFSVKKCCVLIKKYFESKKIVIIKDFLEELEKYLTVDKLGFTSELLNGIDENKNIYIINFISNDIEDEDVYTKLIFLLLTSLYPVSYNKQTLNPDEDHSDDLVKFIDKYRKCNTVNRVFYDPSKSDCSDDKAAMTLLIRAAAKAQHELAKKSIGRLIPPALSSHYPRLENPTLRGTYSNQDEHLPLEVIVKKYPENHIMAIGNGGCGKTYTLIELAGNFLNEQKNAIPIYISLNDFNSTSKSVIDYFCDLLHKNSKFNTNEIKERLTEWLRDENREHLLLLLDGYNEISSTDLQVRIASEVKQLQADYENIQFVITSRYDMKDSFVSGLGNAVSPFLSYSVDELSSEVVTEFIKEFHKGRADVANIIQKAMISEKNRTVKSFLRNPMALVMYCFMNGNEIPEMMLPHRNYQTLGELIDNYVWLIKISSENTNAQREANNKAELFMQYVGFCMNNDGLFKITESTLGQYAREFGLIDTAEWENVNFVKDMTKYILNGNDVAQIEFIHQNYRDFFAARYLKNVLRSGDRERINRCFGDKIIPNEVLVLLGEILEEYQYKDIIAENSGSVIQTTLSEIGSYLPPAAIAQLIQTASIARGRDLSSFDFSYLDLSATSLNGVKLYKDASSSAVFNHAIITKSTLNATGQPGSVASMLLIENRFLITFSKLGIFCFDMQLRKHYRVTDYYECAIHAAVHLNDSKFILTGDSWGNIVLWEYSVGKELEFRNDNQVHLYDKLANSNGSLCELHDLVVFKDRIYASVAKGDVWSFVIKQKSISDLRLERTFNCSVNTAKPSCRLSVSETALYGSFGNILIKLEINFNGVLELTAEKSFEGTEIIDIATVGLEESEDVLVNLRKADMNTNTISEVIRFSFDDDNFYVIEQRVHSIKRVGFKGWNSFTETYCDAIFLTANIEDAIEAAGLLKIYFPDNLKEKYRYESIDFFGNRHSMSVNCGIAFNYNRREYIATGSTERSVEILSASGGNATLLYHLMGYDNGIHYIDIVDNNRMYTAHYSGEVSEWLYNHNHWKCTHVYSLHSNWVWECRHVAFGESSYVVSCSYDNTISVVNTHTEECVCRITEPTSRVLSFGFLSENILLTGYTKNGNSVLRKFFIDFENKSYTAGKEILALSETSSELRSIYTAANRLLLCANSLNNGYVISVPKDVDLSLDEINFNKIYKIDEDDQRINLRCADEIIYNGCTIIACGGDYHDSANRTASYIRVWCDNDSGNGSSCFDPDSGGCSTLRLIEYLGDIYLIAGNYDGFIFVYSINPFNGKTELINSSHKLNDKILNIQVFNDNIFLSLLNGSVYTFPLSELTRPATSQTSEAEEIFRAVSGLRCCNVDFTNAQTNWDNAFKKLISYYGRVGR